MWRTGRLGVLVLVAALAPAPAADARRDMAQPAPPGAWVAQATSEGLERPATAPKRFFEALEDGRTAAAHEALAEWSGSPSVTSAEGFPGYAAAFLQGDATGDGVSETLVIRLPEGRDPVLGLEMVTPPGHSMWAGAIRGSGVTWTLDRDLDGDGLTDLLFVARDVDSSGNPTTQLTALRGSDGVTLWTKSYLGVGAFQSAAAAGYVVAAGAGAGLGVFPLIGPDADGDGGADVWVNEFDVAAAVAGEKGVFDPVVAAGAVVDRFTLLSGADGVPVSSTAAVSGGTTVVLPSEDLTGDGLADSVATQITSVGPTAVGSVVASTVSGLSGRTATALWAHSFATFAAGVPAPDLTGDGRADVLIPEGGSPGSLNGVSGSDGATLWRIVDPLFGVVVPGNIDGEAGHDVMFLDVVHESAPRGMSARFQAVRGDTGALLYDEQPFFVPLPDGGYASVGFTPLAGDMDGDGVLDAVLNTATGPFLGQDTGDIYVVSGSRGTILWARFGRDLAGRGGGDLDGDGLDDVLQIVTDAANQQWDYAALSGTTGDVRWTRSYDGSSFVRSPTGKDLGGGSADDVLFFAVYEEEDEGVPLSASIVAHTVVEAVAGPDGAVLWNAPGEVPL